MKKLPNSNKYSTIENELIEKLLILSPAQLLNSYFSIVFQLIFVREVYSVIIKLSERKVIIFPSLKIIFTYFIFAVCQVILPISSKKGLNNHGEIGD